MSDVGNKTSERAQSLVNEVGDELLDLEATYRSARSALVDEDADRRRKTDELLEGGTDRHELVQQVVTLKTELTRQTEQLGARDEHVKALRAQIVELEDRVGRGTDLELQLGDVRNEVDRSRRDVERFKSLADARVVERDEIASQVRLLEVEKAQLRREVEASNDELELIANERSEMRKRIQRLEAEAVRVRRDHESRQVQLAASVEERTDLQKRLAMAQESHSESLSRVNEAEGLIERRNNEIAHLKKRTSRLEIDLSTLTEAATQLELRTAERDKLLRRVEVLESELTAQTTEAGASKKALELLAARTTERDTLEQKVADLETRLADASNKMRNNKEFSSELEARTAERNALEHRITELEAEVRAEQAEVTEWRESADLLAALTSERDALKRHVAVLQEQLDSRASGAPQRKPKATARVESAAEPAAQAAPSAPKRPTSDRTTPSGTHPSSLSARIAELEARMSEELDGLDPESDARARDRLTASAVATAAALRDLPSEPSYEPYEREPADEPRRDEARGRGVERRDRESERIDDRDIDDAWDDDYDEYDDYGYDDVDDRYDDDVDDRYDDGVDAYDDQDWDDDYDEIEDGGFREPQVLGADDDGGDFVSAGTRDIDGADEASGTLRWNDDILPAASAPTGFDEIPDDQYDDAGKAALDTLGLTDEPADDAAPSEAGMLAAISDDGLVATPSQATLDLYAEALRDLGAGNSSSMIDKAKRGAGAIGKGAGRKRIRLPSSVAPDGPEAAHHLLDSGNVVLIVDGHDMLSEGQDRDRARSEAADTIDALATLATKYSASVEVVFDGNALDPDGTLGSRHNVRVRFARGGVGVGEVLMRLCDTFPGGQALVLAASDGRVREAARRARINLLSVDQLAAALKT